MSDLMYRRFTLLSVSLIITGLKKANILFCVGEVLATMFDLQVNLLCFSVSNSNVVVFVSEPKCEDRQKG